MSGGAAGLMVTVAIIALWSSLCNAYDVNPLQDFCVGVPDTLAADVQEPKACYSRRFHDFRLSHSGAPDKVSRICCECCRRQSHSRPKYSRSHRVRVDIIPDGVVPPHTHPRATEIIVVLEGTIYAGFVTSNPNDNTKNRLFAKILKAGDLFVFPIGLVHFQRNVGKTKAMGIVAFNSQNPGVITIANSVFGTEPHISPEVLTKSFQLDKKIIDYLQSKF